MAVNQRKIGVVLSYISAGLAALVSLLYTPLMLRLLGQSEYGVYNTALAFISYLSLMQLGLNSAYVRFFARCQTRGDAAGVARLNGLYLFFYLVIAALSVVAGILLVKVSPVFLAEKLTASELGKAQILMKILIGNTAISFPFTLFASHITANEKYIFARLMTIINQVVNPFVAIPLLLLGYKSVGLVVATVIITLTIGISQMIYCFRRLKMRFLFGKMDFSLMREILVYTSYIFIGTVVNQINWSLGRIVLAGTVGAVAVAIYSVSEQLNQYYISMSTTVSDVFTPRVHRMAAQGASDRDFTDLFTRIGRIQFLIMAMILMGFAVFGESFIGKWAGVEYVGTGAYLCGVLLFVANLVPGIQNVGIAIQQSKNLHRFRSLLYLTLCFVNIGVAIPLSRAFGPLGAAVAMLAVTLFGNGLVMNIYYHKKIGIDIPYFWRQIASMCRGLAAPLLYGAFVLLFIDTDSWRRMAVFGALFVAVYLVSMWFFGMNDYERGLFTRPLKKRFARPSRRNG